jgi:hypothetical protein
LEKEKPLIFDYRYDDEASVTPYQLTLRRSGQPINNALLFLRLYALLESLYQPEREPVYFNDLEPALEYHYWRFWPRFAFVNELADQYEQAKKDGLPGSAPVNAYLDYWLAQKQNNSAIYEGTIRLSAIADGSIKFQRDIPAGTPYTYIPEPVNDLEAFQRLKFLMGPQVAEHYIAEFQQKYKEPTAEIYAAELAPINTFINDIDYAELKAAFERADNNYAQEYLRITQGYYENHRCEQGMGNTAAMVYGKYILYKKWLEDRLRESFKPKKARGLPQLEPGKVSKDFVLGQELFNTLYQRGLLADFFSVPAPPFYGRFWYDIHDQDTDDPAKVVRVSPVAIRQSRRAGVEDFQTVLDRVNPVGDTRSKAYQHFLDDLVACIQQMISFHRTLHKPEERSEEHYQLIELAENFTTWLKPKEELSALSVQEIIRPTDLQILDALKRRTEDLPDILHLRAPEMGYQLTPEDKRLLLETYRQLDDILKEVAAFINIRFPGAERHTKAWNDIDFDTKIGDFKIITNDQEHIKREWRKGMFDLLSLIKILQNETLLRGDAQVPDYREYKLAAISANHPLEFYTDEKNIPNQNLVKETISFFDNSPGKDLFTPLQILNLIHQQKQYLMSNYQDGTLVLEHFKQLPLTGRSKHSFYGFLLKWFGGYPVNNMDEDFNATLKLVQKEFLDFAGDTPEKQYCKADQAMRNKFERYGIAFTTAINHGIDVAELLAAMEADEPEIPVFQNFGDLFLAAVKDGLIENFADRKDLLIAQSTYHYQFNIWLQTHKDWEYRSEENYLAFLNKDTLIEFLAFRSPKPTIQKQTRPARPEVKLTIAQIALICHYTECTVTRSTAKDIVTQYGHTSGDRLFNSYSHYRSKANRTGAEITRKRNANKLQLFETVAAYLNTNEAASKAIQGDLIKLRQAINEVNLTL